MSRHKFQHYHYFFLAAMWATLQLTGPAEHERNYIHRSFSSSCTCHCPQ